MKFNGYVLGILGIILSGITFVVLFGLGMSGSSSDNTKEAAYIIIPISICWIALVREVIRSITKRDYLTNFDVVILLLPILWFGFILFG